MNKCKISKEKFVDGIPMGKWVGKNLDKKECPICHKVMSEEEYYKHFEKV